MNEERFWKILAIVSISLLVIVICTSSYSLCVKLNDVAGKLDYIAGELNDIDGELNELDYISSYLYKIYSSL